MVCFSAQGAEINHELRLLGLTFFAFRRKLLPHLFLFRFFFSFHFLAFFILGIFLFTFCYTWHKYQQEKIISIQAKTFFACF
jgi:hypothetical protein